MNIFFTSSSTPFTCLHHFNSCLIIMWFVKERTYTGHSYIKILNLIKSTCNAHHCTSHTELGVVVHNFTICSSCHGVVWYTYIYCHVPKASHLFHVAIFMIKWIVLDDSNSCFFSKPYSKIPEQSSRAFSFWHRNKLILFEFWLYKVNKLNNQYVV